MASRSRCLTALPVYNEASHLDHVLCEVRQHAKDILVVDDGSTDGTREKLAEHPDVLVARHPENRGYGAALQTAFEYAIQHDYTVVVTIDCDGQHEPQRIAELFKACRHADIASGSRYLSFSEDEAQSVPVERRGINQTITAELNDRLGLELTDAFCGFKAYRVSALERLQLTEDGYAMPLELWVQAVHRKLRVVEVAVPLIYLDEKRSFGGALDQANTRLAHYREVIDRAIDRLPTPLAPGVSLEPAPLSIKPCLEAS